MELEMQVHDPASAGQAPTDMLDRLAAATVLIEQAAARLTNHEVDLTASVGRAALREADLVRLLAEANATIASLKGTRKTQPAGVAALLAKDGTSVEAASLDNALASLSLEQRFAVKAQLLRSGLIG
jgi:hypothetical protein